MAKGVACFLVEDWECECSVGQARHGEGIGGSRGGRAQLCGNCLCVVLVIGRKGGKATGKRKARTAAQCRAAQRASVAARLENKQQETK